ncbi:MULTISPECIES: MBL fold metallo-hydrolase [unclassified Caballeronia]|uniref:MBL fold metallo-hydrolase n=1 Tax=unclassified Caballeronia TaxID=2646786 RepID=UPI002857F92F|nr:MULTISPECIES: MBL fold metallo-hydrolase [unclassified Caballeronia]MDR5763166.1 MBL fold metallo-hydrolase [Caballeronia sp. LZ035]MDR5883964.1 MBL fold metallo-hydrolase [Caballeronia sp. LZ032]
MRVHHLNCISSCPLGGKLFDGRTPSLLRRGELTCHCLLVESEEGLVLIDTGFGLRDVADPRNRLSAFFLLMLKPEFREEMTAIRQIERLGFSAADVRHIVLSHLDFDHAGGLDDFPNAIVHMLRIERDYAVQQRTWLDRQRFRPQQWSTQPNWQFHDAISGDRWHDFECVRPLSASLNDIALVPLTGHTFGHAGIAVHKESGWLLMAADAYFFHTEMDLERPRCTPGLAVYQWLMDKDRTARRWNQARLRRLCAGDASSGKLDVCCSHDPTEFERLAGRSAGVPAEAFRQPRCARG